LPAAGDALAGRGVGSEPLVSPVSNELECDRGRVADDAASLGSVDAPFRELLFGVPEARFLFLMTSVFNESGLTTPCSL